MKVLREVAEADRRSLLGRLGRKEIGTTIVGTDAGLRPVLERVKLVASSDVPILIFGETGTGKEVIARVIHSHSPRASGPLIRVNCGAIPPELIDSQLFGHEKGSFTGASERHRGWFERADAGTLFLDEIGDLPLAAQVRLLRVLQDGFVERVGGQQSVRVDVRVVGATHRDLPALVRQGKFREDLWYRLAVFPIPIPPLRARTEDIAPLACHFAEKAATRFGLPLVMPTPEDVRQLIDYAWPGNVRELASVIDRAALLGNGRRLDIGAALGLGPPPHVARPLGVSATFSPGGNESASLFCAPGGDLQPSSVGSAHPIPMSGAEGQPQEAARPVAIDEAMRQHIEAALRATYGRIEGKFGVAALLKINPHTLRARMRKLGIDWQRFR